MIHRIGLVSDTHGVYHSGLDELLKGVEEILHAGDIGDPEVLEKLERIAPVTAVSGNVDVGPTLVYPAFALRDLYGMRVMITHYVGTPAQPIPPVASSIEADHPDVVLSGHTHKPLVERQGKVLFINPGSCGPRRFRLPCSCGILSIEETPAGPRSSVQLLDLSTGRELAEQKE